MLSICQVRSRQVKLNMELIYYNLVNFILLVTLQIFFYSILIISRTFTSVRQLPKISKLKKWSDFSTYELR